MESGAALWVRSTASRARGATAVVLPALPHHHCTSYTTQPVPAHSGPPAVGQYWQSPATLHPLLSLRYLDCTVTILSVNRLDNSLENKI